MYLAQALRIKSRVSTAFNMADNSNLKAWYKYNTGLTLDGNEIDEWADSSNNATNMDLTPQAADNITRFISGNVVFSTANKSYLQSANQLNLGQFTIFAVMDFNELEQGSVSTDVANLLDFNQLGFGVLDSKMNEVAIYDTHITPANRAAIRNDIKTRNGL